MAKTKKSGGITPQLPNEWYVKKGTILRGKYKKSKHVPAGMAEELLHSTDDGKELIAILLNQAFQVKEMSPLAYASVRFLVEIIQTHKEQQLQLKSKDGHTDDVLSEMSAEDIVKLAK